MPNQMQRFTNRAREIMTFAQQEATSLRHPQIEPEHFLLAMLRENEGIAGRTLRELGLGYNQLQQIVGNLPVEAFENAPLDLSDHTKRLLEGAVAEASQMGHHEIGTEHLLLGLVRGQNRAVEILAGLGVSVEEVQRYTRRVMQEAPLQPLSSTAGSRLPLPNISARLTELLRDEGQPMNTNAIVLGWLHRYNERVTEVLAEMGADVDQFWRLLEAKINNPPGEE